MSKALGNSWIVIVVSAAMLLVVAAACGAETVEVPGETVVVEKEVVKEVMVPGETVVQEVIKEVMVPGETVVVEKVVTETVEVPGETVVVEKVVTETVEVPGATVVQEVVKEVMVPGETVVVEKEVVKTVEVPGQTVVVEKEVVKEVMVPGETVVVEKEVVKEVMVPGETVVVEKVVEVEVPAMSMGPQGTITVGWSDFLSVYGLNPTVHGGNSIWLGGYAAGDHLMKFNTDFEMLPQLAKSWSQSDDGLVWTFKLEEGVQFQKGYGEMTADDVIFTFQQYAAEGSLHHSNAIMRRLWANPDGWVKAPDPYTVQVHTGTFQWDMPFNVSNDKPTISRVQTEELGVEAASAQAAATGSWDIREQRPGYWKFEAVVDHWRKTPEFAELVYLEMPEEATRIANFQVGKLDIMKMELDSYDTIAKVPGTKFMSVPGAGAEHVMLMGSWYTDAEWLASNCSDWAWISCDPDVNSAEWEVARKLREALAIGFDRQLIVDTYLGGQGSPSSLFGWEAPFVKANLDADLREWPFDPERAKELMAEAGYPDGFEINVATGVRGVPGEIEACEYMGSAWNEIGIKANVQRIPWDSFVPQLIGRTWVGAECHGTSTRAEPSVLWGGLTGANIWHGNWHSFYNEIIPKVGQEVDEAKRWELKNELARFMYENALDWGTYSVNVVFPVGSRLDTWDEWLRAGTAPSAFEYASHRK